MVQVDEVDEEALSDVLADYLIQDFRGIGDAAGVPLPLTIESKKLILDQITLSDFAWASAQAMDMTAERPKNLPTP